MERWHVVCVLDWTFFLPLAPTKIKPLAHRPPPPLPRLGIFSPNVP